MIKAVLLEVSYVDVEITPEGQERLELCKAQTLCCGCLEPIEPDDTVRRGMHKACHQATMTGIRRGIITEAKRMSEGKMLPAETGGRKPTNPVAKELAGVKS